MRPWAVSRLVFTYFHEKNVQVASDATLSSIFVISILLKDSFINLSLEPRIICYRCDFACRSRKHRTISMRFGEKFLEQLNFAQKKYKDDWNSYLGDMGVMVMRSWNSDPPPIFTQMKPDALHVVLFLMVFRCQACR